MSRARWAGAAAAALICAASGAALAAPGTPVTLHDLLHLSRLEAAGIAPDGHHVVVQFAAPYDTASAYDNDLALEAQLSRLRLVSVQGATARATRTLRALPGPFSPDGRRMAIVRLKGMSLELGVATLSSGSARWLKVAVEPAQLGRAVQWRGSDRLVLLSPVSGARAGPLQAGAAADRRAQALRARQRIGRRPALTRLDTTSGSPADVRLVEIGASGGGMRVLARGAFDDVEVSPNGRWAAIVGRGAPEVLSGDARFVADSYRQRRLRLVDLSSGAASAPCPGLDLLPTVLNWSSKGERLLVVGRDANALKPADAHARIVQAAEGRCTAPQTDAALAVTRVGSEGLETVSALWVGDKPIFQGHAVEAGPAARLAVKADPRRASTFGNAARGVPTQRGRRLKSPRSISPPAERPDMSSDVPPEEPFAGGVRLALRMGATPPVASEALARRGGLAVIVRRSSAGVTRVSLRIAPQGRLMTHDEELASALAGKAVPPERLLLTLNAGLVGRLWSTPRPLPSSASDAPHWLYLPPPGSMMRGPPPLVVLPYPGSVHPQPSARFQPGELSLTTQVQLITAHGFAVLVPSLPAHPGVAWAAGLGPQLMQAIDAASADGHVDGARVALWGHSFGGWSVLMAAERFDGLAAVIAENAPSDLISMRGVLPAAARAFADPDPSLAFFTGWSEAGQGDLRASPWLAPASYVAASPLLHADQLKAPVLLVAGEGDFISPGQAEEMFAALRRQNKAATLLTFWGEGHVLTSPANITALYRAAFAFLDAAFSAGPSRAPTLRSPPDP